MLAISVGDEPALVVVEEVVVADETRRLVEAEGDSSRALRTAKW